MLFRHDGQTVASDAQGLGGGTAGTSGVIVDRPPPGLARGKYATSPLLISALGSLLVLGTLLYYFFRLRRPRT